MKVIFAIAALAATSIAVEDSTTEFIQFMAKFNKSYESLFEYKLRAMIFAEKDAIIKEHNASGKYTYTLGHNHMSDWANFEYTDILNYIEQPQESFDEAVYESTPSNEAWPVDWRNEGVVAPIQDQGQCGSCWAFSTMASLESAHAIASGSLEKFAEQQLVDCVKTSFGCNGGNVKFANTYLKSHGAILESDYPYTAENGTCMDDTLPNTGVMTTGTDSIKGKSPDAMKDALANGPISVGIQANKSCFQLYSSGIFADDDCGGLNLDHATNVVGWGLENGTGTEYWIMRNSWASTWGEDGYMRIEIKDGKGYCGIQKQPLVASGVN